MSQAVVLDLDDTLYLERDFVRSGFSAAGLWYNQKTGSTSLEEICLELFAAGRRSDIFNQALERLDAVDPETLTALIEVYRGHAPRIDLAADASRYLGRRHAGRRHAIITDGHAATQQAKVRSLGLEGLVDHVIYTDLWGRDFWKPHARAFEAVETLLGLGGTSMVYVADNPSKDFVTPRALGWWTIQMARSERVHVLEVPSPAHAPHFVLESFDELDACLSALGPPWARAAGTDGSPA